MINSSSAPNIKWREGEMVPEVVGWGSDQFWNIEVVLFGRVCEIAKSD
jgi:hypothetical protein